MTTSDALVATHTLPVSGTRLHYEVRGSGPLLFVIGSPMQAAEFAAVADALATDHTVVAYDPRGFGGSPIDDPEQDSTPELRADDVVAILDDVGADSADLFGSSGGAVTGLALAVRHPGRLRTLIAHEPPLMELLDDATQHRANTEGIIETFHRDGHQAAWMHFMSNAGFDLSAPPGGPHDQGAPLHAEPEEPSATDLAEAARFFDHELRPTTQYIPDTDALVAGPTRVVIGLGADSGHLLTDRTSRATAHALGSETVEFPGDHGGFMGLPAEFADAVRRVLG